MRNYPVYRSTGTIENNAQYLKDIANTRKGATIKKWNIHIFIKKDKKGYIIDPEDINLKCGWGEDIQAAYSHFKKRNNLYA